MYCYFLILEMNCINISYLNNNYFISKDISSFLEDFKNVALSFLTIYNIKKAQLYFREQ
jgi:hypothetical protein